MSYNLSVPDDSSFNRYIPEMISTDTIDYQSLIDLPFSPFYDSSSDYNLQQQISVDESSDLLPSNRFENLSLYRTTEFESLSFGHDSEYEKFEGSDCLRVKNEEGTRVDFDVHENVGKYLQRSYSSNCFEGKKSDFSFEPRFDSVMESDSFQGQALSLPEKSFFISQMRKVSSTGDLEGMRNVHSTQRSNSTPSAIENSLTDESPFKVGRYNAEERQERISKYRAKRSQRNFNKTIKYACRKTLADTRPRIRGRFARNDETVESPVPACTSRDEDENDIWVMLHEVEDVTMATREISMNSFGSYQFQFNHGCF